jgi:HSP20 family protein
MNSENAVAQTDGDHVGQAELTRSGRFYRPNVDILEGPDQLVVHADMPGTSGENIDIDFKDGSLTIHGRVPARQDESTQYLLQEFGVGDYYRTFQVSEHIDAGRIAADYSSGVLTLTLPKVEAAKPRKIAVKAK